MQAARTERTHDAAIATPQRRRHWPWVVAIVALLLLAYAVALAWVTRKLEADVQRSLHPVPAVQEAARPGD